MQEKKERHVVVNIDYVDTLGGDILAAMMLCQIIYWYRPDGKGQSKLRKFRDSKWWVAKSNVDWQEECGFTRAQTRRCLKVLEEKGIIETKLYRFDGVPTLHLRLKNAVGKPLIHGFPDTNHWLFQSNPLVVSDQTITDTTAETTTESKGFGVKSHATPETPEVIMLQDKQKGSAEEVLAELKKKQIEEKPIALKPAALADYWRKQCKLAFDDMAKSVQPTAKELGQWKLILNKTGDAPALVKSVVAHWKPFTLKVYAATGDNSKPERPNVGFLLKHLSIALNWYDTLNVTQFPKQEKGTEEKPTSSVVTLPPSYYMTMAAKAASKK